MSQYCTHGIYLGLKPHTSCKISVCVATMHSISTYMVGTMGHTFKIPSNTGLISLVLAPQKVIVEFNNHYMWPQSIHFRH